jgi:DHA2 family multidrug resistance protein
VATSSPETRLRGLPLVLATFAVAVASFMNILDTTIAVVAVPTISGNLGATPSQGSWIFTIYSVCLAVVLPLSGWITRRYGQVRVFCIGLLLFTLTSWLCAIADTFNQLLLFRAFQGASGGLLVALSQSLLLRIWPPEKHGMALGIWGITSAVAPVLGPLLGGYITDNFGWPWIFLINLPVGAVSVYICWTLLRPFESETHRDPVDFVGLLLLMVGVICFQLFLDRGHELDWLASIQMRVLLVVAVFCFFLFLAWEVGEAHPVVDLSLFTYRNFVTGTALISVLYVCFVLATVLYPIWLQTAMGYTATWAGLVNCFRRGVPAACANQYREHGGICRRSTPVHGLRHAVCLDALDGACSGRVAGRENGIGDGHFQLRAHAGFQYGHRAGCDLVGPAHDLPSQPPGGRYFCGFAAIPAGHGHDGAKTA